MPQGMIRRWGAALGGGIAALALAALPAAAEPALWKVQGPHATVYLFGTVHVLKPTTVWRTPKIDAALGSAGTLYEEVPNIDDQSAAMPLILKYGVDAAHPLSSKLTDTQKTRLATVEASLGVAPAQLEPLQPWMASILLSELPIVKAGYDPKSGVDIKLKDLAVEQHKPIAGFETLEQQIRYFADLSEPVQVEFLFSTLDDADKGSTQLDQLVDAWSAGDTDKLQALMNADLRDKYPALYKLLLADRNAAFAKQIETLLKGEGTVFVAVGAAHLIGPDSVQADLAKDGIKAVR